MQPRPSPTFGRRAVVERPPVPAADPHALSEAAERFRAELGQAPGATGDAFSTWKRSRTAARLAAWAATFALLSPGALCFGMQAPKGVSAGVEVLGIAASWWLRRQRRAHLAAIRDWAPQGD